MKKIGTILLLLLVVQYTFGLFTVYVWNSIAIKQSMKSAIAAGSFRHSQVHTIIVPLQHLTATDAAYWQQDEISSNGKMYDVVSARQANGQLTIKCICDDDENLLITTYRQAIENEHKSAPDKNSAALKNIFSPFVINEAAIDLLPKEKEAVLRQLTRQVTFTKVHCSGVLTPPPRQV